MRFAIYTGTKYKEIPQDFNNIEEVRKLRVLKDHPDWPVVPWPISLETQRIIAASYEKKVTPPTPTVATILKKPRSKVCPTAAITAQRKELRQIENSLPTMCELRTKLYNLERSAHRLMYRDSTCGLHTRDTDYWVSLSISYDNICAAIKKANLRKKQLVNSYKHNSVVE